MKNPRLAPVVLFLMLLVPASAIANPPDTSVQSLPLAPHFTLETAQGTVDSDSLRGEVVLLDFWASWCGPCEHSFPWLRSVEQRFAPSGLRVVAVNLDKKRAAAEKFLHRHDAPFTVAFDPDGLIADAFDVPGMPTSVLIDPQGRIVYSQVGFDAGKTGEMESRIREVCR